MAEKIMIASLDIDVKKLLTNIDGVKGKIDELNKKQAELKKAGDTSSDAFKSNEKALVDTNKTYAKMINTLDKVAGNVDDLTDDLKKEIKALDDSEKSTKDVEKAKKALSDVIEDTTDSIEENTKAVDKNNDELDDTKKAGKSAQGGFNLAQKGAKGLGMALKSLGIGLIVAAVAALTDALSKNEKVMLVVNTAMNAFGAVVQPLLSALVEGVQVAYQATGGFDAMGRVISSVISLALTPFQVAFYAIKDAVLSAQLGWEQSIFGSGDASKIASLTSELESTRAKVKELGDDALEASQTLYTSMGEAVGEVSSTFTAIGDKAGQVIDDIKKKGAGGILSDAMGAAKFEQELDKLDQKQEELMLKFQKEAELLRQRRDNEALSASERRAANEELIGLLEQQEAAEKAIVNQKIAGWEQMLAINKDDAEAQVGLMEARNQLLDIEERVTGQISEQMSARNGFYTEDVANAKAATDQKAKDAEEAKQAELDRERTKQEELQALRDEFSTAETEKAQMTEQQKVEQYYENKAAEIERLVADHEERTELLKNLAIQRDEALLPLKEKEAEDLRVQKENEIQQYYDAEQAKINAKREGVDAIGSLFGEETAMAKAAMVAKAILSMQEFINEQTKAKALAAVKAGDATASIGAGMAKTASVGFPWNIPMIAGFIAQTAGIVSSIMSAVKGIGGKPSIKTTAPNLPKKARGGILEEDFIEELMRGPKYARGGVLDEEFIQELMRGPKYAAGGILRGPKYADGGLLRDPYEELREILNGPKYAAGGILRGPSHAQGGIPTRFGELEGGESVINKKNSKLFRPLLSAINSYGGNGVKFAQGGVLGQSTAGPSAQLFDYETMGAQVANAYRSLPPAQVSIEEIRDTQRRVEIIEQGARL